MKKWYIYIITNKLNNKKYIGQHNYLYFCGIDLINDGYMGSGFLLHKAYKKYDKINFDKEILVSDINTKKEADSIEIEHIKLFNTKIPNGYNIADGGQGGNLSIETRKKISESKIGHIVTEDTREKLRQHNLGKKHSEETKKKISRNNIGKKHTEDAKIKIGEKSKLKIFTDESKQKMSEKRKGKKWNPNYTIHSDETKQKIKEHRANQVMPKWSEERREKFKKSTTGKKRTLEQNLANSIAQKKAYQKRKEEKLLNETFVN